MYCLNDWRQRCTGHEASDCLWVNEDALIGFQVIVAVPVKSDLIFDADRLQTQTGRGEANRKQFPNRGLCL